MSESPIEVPQIGSPEKEPAPTPAAVKARTPRKVAEPKADIVPVEAPAEPEVPAAPETPALAVGDFVKVIYPSDLNEAEPGIVLDIDEMPGEPEKGLFAQVSFADAETTTRVFKVADLIQVDRSDASVKLLQPEWTVVGMIHMATNRMHVAGVFEGWRPAFDQVEDDGVMYRVAHCVRAVDPTAAEVEFREWHNSFGELRVLTTLEKAAEKARKVAEREAKAKLLAENKVRRAAAAAEKKKAAAAA